MTIKAATQRFLDWTILLLWLVAGCAVFVIAANQQNVGFGPLLVTIVIFAVGPIAGCVVALRNRKRASQIFLVSGGLAVLFLIISGLFETVNDDHHFRGFLSIFGFISASFAIPGFYWLITARRHCQPYIQHSFSVWTNLAFGIGGLLVLLTGSFWVGFTYFPYGDCGPGLFSSPRYTGHNAYTAKIIYVHRPGRYDFPRWAIVRTEHKYWGISGWNQTFTILPYIDGKVGDEYLVEGHIRRSLAGYLFNVLEINCTLSRPISAAAIELHLLENQPAKNGIRIIGQVLKRDLSGKNTPVPNFPVTLILDHGPEIAGLTNAQGIFDYPGMPAVQFDVHLKSLSAQTKIVKYGECSERLVSQEIAECTLIIPASAIAE